MKKRLVSFGMVAGLFCIPQAWSLELSPVSASTEDASITVVEAVGYGMPAVGRDISDLYLEVRANALKNAVLHARVCLDTQVVVNDLRFIKRKVRMRSVGYIAYSHVLDAGFMSEVEPSMYRIRMEVGVRSVFQPSSEVAVSSHVVTRPPTIILTVQSSAEPDHKKSSQESLSAILQTRGIQMVEATGSPEALIVKVTMTKSPDNTMWNLQWKMERIKVGSSQKPYVIDSIRGDWPISTLLFSDEWNALSELLAKDIWLLWSKPPFGELDQSMLSENEVAHF